MGETSFTPCSGEPADVPKNLLVPLTLPPISHGGSVMYRTNIVCIRIGLVQASLEVPSRGQIYLLLSTSKQTMLM